MSERQRLPRLRRGSGENHTSDHKMKQENMKMMFLQLVAKNPVSWSGVWNGQGSAPRGGTDGRSGLHCRGWCERRWRMRTTAQVSDALPVLDSKLSRLRLRGTNNMSVRNRLVCCRLGDTTSTFWCFKSTFFKVSMKGSCGSLIFPVMTYCIFDWNGEKKCYLCIYILLLVRWSRLIRFLHQAFSDVQNGQLWL